MAERLRFAAGSCQSFDTGYYTAHRYLAEEDLDLFVFLGDYIYEGNPGPGEGRRSNPQETDSLDGFRNRHAHYKTDPNLQASHAAFPWIVTWDDHEVINDYAGDNGDPAEFLKLRAAAYRAYYEHMPLRRAAMPKGPDMLLYRDLSIGRLVAFNVLDTRQYRTALPCGGWRSEACEDSLSPENTITGVEQEAWLYQRLRNSPAHWNVLAQQVPMMQRLIPDGGKLLLAMDKWDGYSASRNRLLHVLEQSRTSNPIVLSGDIHSGWVGDLKSDFADEKSATIGTEFVCTSITSGGNGRPGIAVAPELLAVNPHLRLNIAQRGYARFNVTPRQWRSDFRVVDYVSRPGSPMATLGGMVIESGRPGARFV
jgi:alkaline phosphatase D